jgi:alkylation response protein AidB-like acyl-CoA dehydrogenase
VDFSLTPEQEDLRDAARRMLAAECPTSLLRAHMDDRSALAGLWRHLSGWVELAHGPVVDLCLFLEELGAVAAPGPFLALAIAAGFGATGTATVAMAGADGEWNPNAEPVKTFVLDADVCDEVVFVVAGPSGPARCAVPATAVTMRAVQTLDSTRRLFEVAVPDGVGDGAEAVPSEVVRDALARAYVCAAAELVGTARTMLDMSLAYAKARVQFDRPIGSFQAIQHKLADMALARERAEAAVFYAAMCLDAGDADRHRAAHVAKAAASEAAHRIAKDAIQIHGGIGFTWEHDLHLFMRRAFVTEHLLGTPAYHHDRLGAMLLA